MRETRTSTTNQNGRILSEDLPHQVENSLLRQTNVERHLMSLEHMQAEQSRLLLLKMDQDSLQEDHPEEGGKFNKLYKNRL
jgi:hypothetical protein